MTNEAKTQSAKWTLMIYYSFIFGSALLLSIAFVGDRLLGSKPVSWAASDQGEIWSTLIISLVSSMVYFVVKAWLLRHVRRKSKTPTEIELRNKINGFSLLWCAVITASIGFGLRGSLILLLLGWGFPIGAYALAVGPRWTGKSGHITNIDSCNHELSKPMPIPIPM